MSRRKSSSFTLLAAIALALAPGVEAQTTIGLGSLGLSYGATLASSGDSFAQFTIGQTILAPTDNVLNSFSFWFGNRSSSSVNVDYRAYVYAWDVGTSRATGPELFRSSVQNFSATTTTAFQQVQFNTGGVSLTTGNAYALFVSTVGQSGSGRVDIDFGGPRNGYAGGDLVRQISDPGFAAGSWDVFGADDLHFAAEFSSTVSVPEPGTYLLALAGLLGLCLVGWHRKEEIRWA